MPIHSQVALTDLRFSVVGPGRVGCSLALWAEARGARLVGVAGRKAAAPPWSGAPVQQSLAEFSSARQDLLLVAVPDAVLAEVASSLAGREQAAVVLHTAGSLGAAVLAPLRANGSSLGTLHPLKAFPKVLPQIEEAQGTFFALDGDPLAQVMGRRLAFAWGGKAGLVPEEARTLYHFAATLAAGGVTTLLSTAAEIATRLGLPPEVSAGLAALAEGALHQARGALAAGRAPATAITGPAARGDRETIFHQLDALARTIPDKVPLTLELLRETLRQVQALHPEDAVSIQRLAAVESVLRAPR